ncbi:MAG: azurin [Xanthomonadaceae bacterium]|jgi:azurin|nr:azurin [Xanthomonadaceae bacterium]
MRTLTLLILVLALLAFLFAAGAARADNCSIDLKVGDSMKFDQRTVSVSSTCKSITIHLAHQGQMPAQSMGHNVVITSTDAFQSVANDGLKAGLSGNYVPPNDKRVIASTKIIGGGEKTTSSFAGSLLKPGAAYTFFCSAPGHSSVMRGQLLVE